MEKSNLFTKKTLKIIFFLFLITNSVLAQQITLDSLTRLLQSKENDSVKISTLNILSWQLVFTNPDSTLILAQLSEKLSNKTDNQLGLLDCYNNFGAVYFMSSDYPKALKYFQLGLKISKVIDNNKGKCNFLNNIGLIHWKQSSLEIALKYYNESRLIAVELDDKKWLINSLLNIGNIYGELNNLDSALVNFSQSVDLIKNTGVTYSLATAYIDIGVIYEKKKDYKSSLDYYFKSLKVARDLDLSSALVTSLTNISGIYMLLADDEADFNKKNKYLNKALDYAKQSLDISLETGNLTSKKLSYSVLANAYKRLNEPEKAYDYLELVMDIQDSIFNDTKMKEIESLEARYKFEKKEEQIKFLEQENQLNKLNIRNKENLLFLAIVIIVIILILIVVIYFYFKNRQIIIKKEIEHKKEMDFIVREKETEKKIHSAVILTENRERKRIAEDLHDTIGPTLSAIKLYVNTIIDYDSADEENKKLIEYTNGLIDESISNARAIAHNLMPSSLQLNGLVNTLKSFCYKITATGNIKIIFDFIGKDDNFDELLEVLIYRVITELINNTIKHAEAKEVNIIITSKSSQLTIKYQDDGKGFDNSEISGTKMGMGLSNIRNRILSVSGKYEIDTSIGNGFAISIEIPLLDN